MPTSDYYYYGKTPRYNGPEYNGHNLAVDSGEFLDFLRHQEGLQLNNCLK
jgi:hypothetical protein